MFAGSVWKTRRDDFGQMHYAFCTFDEWQLHIAVEMVMDCGGERRFAKWIAVNNDTQADSGTMNPALAIIFHRN